jgi:anti-sigma-K factor RskA
MSDDMRERDCRRHAGELPELALGVLTGRERAEALSHVESCPRCADELEQLSRVADTVVQAAPEVEPPVGFEVRLLERMGVAAEPPRRRRLRTVRRIRPAYWVPATMAAAAALALGLGLGLSGSAPSPTVATGRAQPKVIAADLVQNGQTVGRVSAFSGAKPWMSMMLDDSAARGTVSCVVVTDDGESHHVGTFVARKGYGAWAAPLTVEPSEIRTAEVVSPSGAVLASATLG